MRSRVTQLRVPVLAAPLRSGIEESPQRIEVRRAAWILSRIRRAGVHLTGPEVANGAVPAREHIVGWHVRILPTHVVPRVIAVRVRDDAKPSPAPGLLGGGEAIDRRTRHENEGNALLERGKLYKMAMQFDDEPAWVGNGEGLWLDNTPTIYIITNPKMVGQFAQRHSMYIWYNQKMITNFSLKGSYAALTEAFNCQTDMDANQSGPAPPAPPRPSQQPSRPAQQASDPFR